MSTTKLLKKIYYDPRHTAGFGSARNLYLAAKAVRKAVAKKDVDKFLQSQPTHTLHFPVRKSFKRRKILARHIDHIWSSDLLDFQAISKENRGFRYVLIVIDVLSRYAFAVPLKDKTAKSVIAAFKKIFNKSGRRPQKLFTDMGKEYTSNQFKDFLRKSNIIQYSTGSEIKASLAERFIRTLKSKLYKYFTAKNTLHYIRVLPSVLQGYNDKIHSSHVMAPSKVNIGNQKKVWNILYADYLNKKPKLPRLHIGDFVRLSKYRRTFRKAYLQGWTTEIFVVHEVLPTNPVTYVIHDSNNEILEGAFYEPELLKIRLGWEKIAQA